MLESYTRFIQTELIDTFCMPITLLIILTTQEQRTHMPRWAIELFNQEDATLPALEIEALYGSGLITLVQ